MSSKVCPAYLSGSLDNRIRRFFQNPQKILSPFIKEGMTVLDMGCGPGFFTLDMALLAGNSGKAIAADLQDEMLDRVRKKVKGTELEKRMIFHKCEQTRTGITEKVDFALAFYMVHEVPDRLSFLAQIKEILKPGGTLLVVEPPFHVSSKDFAETLNEARSLGYEIQPGPKMFPDKTAILIKN